VLCGIPARQRASLSTVQQLWRLLTEPGGLMLLPFRSQNRHGWPGRRRLGRQRSASGRGAASAGAPAELAWPPI